MNYQLEIKHGKFSLYSPKIKMYVMQDVTMEEVQIALATEMEYKAKLEIVKMLMTFPHGYQLVGGPVIDHETAVKAYNRWHKKISQRIIHLDEYYALIDQKMAELFQ